MQPAGGTELQHAFLEKYVDKKLLDNFQICTSVPGKIPLSKDKINILWQKNSYDQPNLQDFFKDKSRHDEYDWYVFNSHWNYEKFRMYFDIPTHKSIVIKNGCTHFPTPIQHKKGDPVRLLFHPTPWRGLNVILAAMQHIKRDDIKLLRQVYRLLFAPEGTFTERLLEVKEVYGSKPLANEILNFLNSNSYRSIVHPGSSNS